MLFPIVCASTTSRLRQPLPLSRKPDGVEPHRARAELLVVGRDGAAEGAAQHLPMSNIGAFLIRIIGLWDILYYSYNEEPPN